MTGTGGSEEFDLNGCTITFTGQFGWPIWVQNGTFTFKNGSILSKNGRTDKKAVQMFDVGEDSNNTHLILGGTTEAEKLTVAQTEDSPAPTGGADEYAFNAAITYGNNSSVTVNYAELSGKFGNIIKNYGQAGADTITINEGALVKLTQANDRLSAVIYTKQKKSGITTVNINGGRIESVNASEVVYLEDGANLNMTGGIIHNTNTVGGWGLGVHGSSNGNIDVAVGGGSIISDNSIGVALYGKSASLTITKGEISGTTGIVVGSNGQYDAEGTLILNAYNDDDVKITGTGSNGVGLEVNQKASATISGGTVTGEKSAVLVQDISYTSNGATVTKKGEGTVVISGGNIEGNVENTSTSEGDNKGSIAISGGTVTGNVSNTGSGSTEISGGNISGNVSTTSGTTKVIGGTITGNVTNEGGTTEVSGGTITGNVAEELIASGYEKDSNGVIRADAAWSLRSSSDVVYDYILKTSTPTTIATATIPTGGDSSVLRHDTQYGLLGVSNEVKITLDSELARQKNFSGAKYNIADGTVAITPLNAGFKIIGDIFVDDATTLTTNDSNSYGIAVDATNNKLANISGGAGNDSIKAGARATTLDGGAGNDTLEGGSEGNTFIYSAGNDVISNYSTTDTFSVASDSDLTPPVDLDKATFNGSNLIITFDDENSLVFRSAADVALVKDTATYSYQGNSNGMNYIALNSETEHGISLGAGYSGRFNGANAANEDYATIDASHVTSAIRVTGNDNNNYMVAGTGGGTFEGGAGNDIINGASATSSLRFVGGAGDDSLVGGSGYNVFVYTEGNDKIKDYHDGDLVNVNNSVNLANAEFSLSGENFVLGFDSGDSLTLENVASVTSGVSIQSGSSSKNIYVYKKDSIARDKSITLTSGFADSIFSAGTYDTVNAVNASKAVSISGNDNNNVIFGSKQGGTLFGGVGKDKLDVTERDSGKTFVFKYTEGKDTVSGFVAGDKLEITADKIDEITKAKSSRSDTRLAFTFNTSKSDVLTFNSEDEIGSVSINGSDAYLTKDGIGGSNSASLNLFASARGKIDLTEAPYASASLNAVDASEVKKQSVTLIGGTQGGSFTFAGNNKKKDLFEYNGGSVSISGYEAGVDRLDLNTAALSGFSVGGTGGNVSLTTGLGTVVLESMQGQEVLLHHAESKRSSFTKMVFKDTGVIFNKEKRPTAATVSGSYNISSDSTASTVKKIFVADGADNISITAGDRNKTTLNASASNGGVTLTGGAKNDKLIGSTDAADTFVYTAGKDIIQNYNSNDEISLGDFASSLTSAKINAGKRSIKFKFSNKNALTIKPAKGSTLGSALNISEFNGYTYAKNAIAQGSNASLTSEFSGSYRLKNSGVNNVDGSRVEKNLTFRGTSADETLSGGTKKTTFKGGGGNDAFTGGSGKDVFFYAKGDSGDATIASFDFTNDKLKIAGGTITNISTVNGGIKFDMNNGRKNSANIGSFTVASSLGGGAIDTTKTLIKANNTYLWFAEKGGTDASGESYAEGALITSVSKVSKSDTTGYAVIDLGYSSNLVNAGVAYKTEQTLTKLSNNDD